MCPRTALSDVCEPDKTWLSQLTTKWQEVKLEAYMSLFRSFVCIKWQHLETQTFFFFFFPFFSVFGITILGEP
jgi:hypothetical protein